MTALVFCVLVSFNIHAASFTSAESHYQLRWCKDILWERSAEEYSSLAQYWPGQVQILPLFFRSEIEAPKLNLEFSVSNQSRPGHLPFYPNTPKGLIKDTDSLSTPYLHFKIGPTKWGIERAFDNAWKLTIKYSEAFFKKMPFCFSPFLLQNKQTQPETK